MLRIYNSKTQDNRPIFGRKKYNSRDRRYMWRHPEEFTMRQFRDAGILPKHREEEIEKEKRPSVVEHLPGEAGETEEEIKRRTGRYIFDPNDEEEEDDEDEEDDEGEEDEEDEDED